MAEQGDVWVRFEPQDEQDDLIFAEEVFGGSVPRNFYPAVEKGLQEAVQKGPLAGYPLVGLKAVLYDGSYHPVDSNEMAFKMAAILSYKEAMPNANPTILEPIGALAVTVGVQRLLQRDIPRRLFPPPEIHEDLIRYTLPTDT